mgnify:CR=1 FL=1
MGVIVFILMSVAVTLFGSAGAWMFGGEKAVAIALVGAVVGFLSLPFALWRSARMSRRAGSAEFHGNRLLNKVFWGMALAGMATSLCATGVFIGFTVAANAMRDAVSRGGFNMEYLAFLGVTAVWAWVALVGTIIGSAWMVSRDLPGPAAFIFLLGGAAACWLGGVNPLH